MPKTFYTERDIEDLAQQGVTSLALGDDVVLTDLARERAERLGVDLVREHDAPSSAPVRPYVAEQKPTKQASAGTRSSAPAQSGEDLHQRVRERVVARLGDDLDPHLLDTIIRRVLNNVGTG